ncbi:hypothetical protein ABT116_30400, partial [Streptomyces sp. NPDC002130]|uniref:hypothetical protein n=1 Tax=Streptomyces sp. NPDC002130 TaxID=3155568 RepID=UPI00331E8E0E
MSVPLWYEVSYDRPITPLHIRAGTARDRSDLVRSGHAPVLNNIVIIVTLGMFIYVYGTAADSG